MATPRQRLIMACATGEHSRDALLKLAGVDDDVIYSAKHCGLVVANGEVVYLTEKGRMYLAPK